MVHLLEQEITDPKHNLYNFSKPDLSINVLGEFNILLNGEKIELKRKSSRQLLQVLLAYRGKKLHKDFLLETIFPNGNIETIHNHFYVALSTLRKSLEPHLKSGRDSQYIIQVGHHYFFKSENVYLDMDEFENLAMKNNTLPIELQIPYLLRAESIYHGPFFEEYPYDPWFNHVRDKLHIEYIRILRTLGHYCWDNLNKTAGIHYFEKALITDSFQEEIYMEYIQRLLEADLHLKAKNVAKRGLYFLEKELGINFRARLNSLFSPFSMTV